MISIIIPLYNKAHTIVRTLTSVMNQTYGNYEVIIVDDGSTDNGVQVIKTHFFDSRIKIIRQNNRGVSMARNRGVEDALGEYIAFLDADDEWHSSYLAYIAKAISSFPDAGMICTAGVISSLYSKSREYVIAARYLGRISEIDFFENPAIFSHTSRTVVQRKIFGVVGGFSSDMECCEDLYLTQKIALLSSVVYIGIPLSKYLADVPGQITRASPQKRYSMLSSVVAYYNRICIFSSGKFSEKMCRRYLRYDIRHRIKMFLRQKDMRSLLYLVNHFDVSVVRLFLPGELSLYCSKFHKCSILWVNFTKLLWRLHCYPIVGAKIHMEHISPIYRDW